MNTRAQQAPLPGRMTADEFLAWSMDQPSGRFELVDGKVFVMAPERVDHCLAKGEAFFALRGAVRASGLECEVFGDGMAVQVSDDVVYEPDVQVRCGLRLPDDAILVPDPLVVVEVLSPSTRAVDTGKKLTGYFALPSVRHYLVLDIKDRTVVHHRRGDEGGRIETRIHRAPGPEGEPAPGGGADLILDPPGLTLRLANLFEAP